MYTTRSLTCDESNLGQWVNLIVATGWVAPAGFRAHIPAMSTIVQCNCGAKYRRTEEKFLVPHTGDAICTVCGAALESWRENTHVPSYELDERPDRSRND